MNILANRFFKITIGIIIIQLIILLMYHDSFIIRPIIDFFVALFLPLLLAAIFYYILRPLVRRLVSQHVPKTVAIFIVYFIVIFSLAILINLVGPIIVEQIAMLTSITPNALENIREQTVDFVQKLPVSIPINEINNLFTTYLFELNQWIINNFTAGISALTKVTLSIVIAPFILFYFLKDDRKLYLECMQLTPKNYRDDVKKVLRDTDNILSTYIIGQLIVSSILGIVLLIGYLLIGLNSAVILALFAMIAIIIPFIGSFIALIPALLVGLSQSPLMALKVILVFTIGITLEANVVSPQVMFHRLHIHPVIVMLLLIASGALYGVWGLFLATPVYAIVRVIIKDLIAIYYGHKKEVDHIVTGK